jgi:glycosyltransferase involved in cell wall biosynthesis
MRRRVLLLSSVHPATDPRILFRIIPSLAPHYEIFCALPDAKQHATETDVKLIPLRGYKSLLSRIVLSHPVLLWKCLRLRPDLVHIFVPELIPVAFLFQWLGAQIIYEVQENLYKKFEIKKNNKHPIFRRLFTLFDHWARRNFYLLFTEQAYLKEYSDLARPFAVVHNFVSIPFIDQYSGGYQVKKLPVPAFFYSGVVSMERCFDTLIAALVLLKTKHPEFHMHLFGPVRFSQEEAEQLPEYKSVSQHLTFYGYTDLRLALPYAHGALAGIALLKPLADYPDSYTTKLFEYMALKLPVITSDFQLYRQIVEPSECGFCISPSSASALSEKLDYIINNPERASEMGNRGRTLVESHYNWKNEEEKLLSFYKRILNKGNNVY